MKTAVIVTTYNRPDALAAVFEGFLEQDDRDFELVVADDGSTEDTKRVVEEYRRLVPFALTYVWQEDRGFRAAAVRNRALATTDAEYVIFTDGDCIPSQGFIGGHKRLAERGYFLGANRVLLSPSFTQRLLEAHLPIHRWGWHDWVVPWLRRDVNRLLPLVSLPDGTFRKRVPDRWEGIKTCNFSAWRDDLIRVNGLDETYQGWGLEDSDLVIRLLHAGVKHKSARFATPVFHLWHREGDRAQLSDNRQRLDNLLQSNTIRAAFGLDQYGRTER
jgi:glycosyltransferase involved in cell wall biosynthesis